MSEQAAEHHNQAAHHHTQAAHHHSEAAKAHENGDHEKAAHHATWHMGTTCTPASTRGMPPGTTWKRTETSSG